MASCVLTLLHMAEVYKGGPSGNAPTEPPSHTLVTSLGDLWCRLFHSKVMMPIHGYYQCRSCFRRIPVSLDTERRKDDPHSPSER